MPEANTTATSTANIVETNIRIVRPGLGLWIATRSVNLEGTLPTPKIVESVCAKLQHRYGLAATPLPGKPPSLIIASRNPVPKIELKDDDWELTISDAGRATRLTLHDSLGKELMPSLIERSILAQIERRTSRWAIVYSPRQWYERDSFIKRQGVKAYRRVVIGTLVVDEVGIGVAADVETSFFTAQPLAWFFDSTQPREEKVYRRQLFDEMAARQQGQGTLIYYNGRTYSQCYFVEAPEGMTCETTPTIRAHRRSYSSLLDYYQKEYPDLKVRPDTPAIYVSFKNLSQPQPVAADRVWLRIFNDSVPESLTGIAQLSPEERRSYIQEFWKEIEPHPIGQIAPGLQAGFWHPRAGRVWHIPGPDLEYGQGRIQHAPTAESSEEDRKNYYRDRMKMLEGGGCYGVPLAVRTVHCAYENTVDEKMAGQLIKDVCELISDWTGKPFTSNLVSYEDVHQAIEKFQQMGKYNLSSGTVLFVLNQEPAAYYEVALGLSEWRPKRVTTKKLRENYRYLKEGYFHKGTLSLTKGRQKWNQFVTLTALDVLQQIDGIPWRIPITGPYEWQLVIDVGHNRRHYALSLLIARGKDKSPSFAIATKVCLKIDHDKETINARILEDEIMNFVKHELKSHPSGRFDPLGPGFVQRDGRLCGDEQGAIDRAMKKLSDQGFMIAGERVDISAFYKQSLKSIRVWDITPEGKVVNVRAGTAVEVQAKMAVLANTGRETLHQGTAEPVVIEANGHCSSLRDAAEAAHAASHLNWSSPTMAQRIGLPFKRTDEELKARVQQEIRHSR